MAKQTRKKGESGTMTITFEPALKKRLKDTAYQRDTTQTSLVFAAVEQYLGMPVDGPANQSEKEFIDLALEFYRKASPDFQETARGLMLLGLKPARGDGSSQS